MVMIINILLNILLVILILLGFFPAITVNVNISFNNSNFIIIFTIFTM